MNCLNNIDRLSITNDLLMDLLKLYQFRGKDFFYADIMKSDLENIKKQTIERETFYAVKWLNLEFTDNRKRLIIQKDAQPKTKDETLMANIKHVFRAICDVNADVDITPNEVLRLGLMLFKDVKEFGFKTKLTTVTVNLLEEKRRVSLREDLDKLLSLYRVKLNSGKYETTQLISNLYIDMINMDLFTSDNELVSLLYCYALIYKERFNLFRYVSFFELLCNNKQSFDAAVLSANFNWKDGYSHTETLHRILVNMLLAGYEITEKMARGYEFDTHQNKSDNIENTITKLGEVFTKEEIRLRHPYVSESTINRTLQRLRDENKIRPNGTGRSATWVRLVNVDRFSISDFRQMDLFEVLDENNDNTKEE